MQNRIPAELRARKQWVVWRSIVTPEGIKKPPYNPNAPQYDADVNDPTTWGTFEQALASVGKGIKAKDKLGKFGLGLISPLNKCERFYFTSALPGRRKAMKWEFVQNTIRNQSDTLTIFLLKSHRPEVYRETVRSEIANADGKAFKQENSLDLSRLSKNELLTLEQLVKRAGTDSTAG